MASPIFYFDLGSPYTYLAAGRIDEVLPVEAAWKPVFLPAIVSASGRPWQLDMQTRRRRVAEIKRRAREYGLPPIRMPATFAIGPETGGDHWRPASTLAIMRVATHAHRSGVGKEFARRAYALAFADGRDITAIDDHVVEAAAACGLDADEVREAPNRQDIKDELRATTEAASASGVIGLPTIALGDRAWWGDDRLDEAAAAILAATASGS